MFALDSLPFNLYMVYLAWQFYRSADSHTSRRLFRYSLIYLPAVMMLMFVSKIRTPSKAGVDAEAEKVSDTLVDEKQTNSKVPK